MANMTSLVHLEAPTFHIADYVVFATFLCLSGAVGVFFSIRGQRSTGEYHLGNRRMHPVPVGISTGVSFLSALSLVGYPAEMFINGYSYIIGAAFGTVGYFVGCCLVAFLLRQLRMTSLNEYFCRRYRSKAVSYAANIMVVLCIFHYMGGCMLGSVLAFNSVTGGRVSVVLGLLIGGGVGIFYTAIGGLKAVVWSDVFQFVVMTAGIVCVVVRSIMDTPGGMAEIIRLNRVHGRFHRLSWSTDVTQRHTGWGLTVGMLVSWMAWSVQPACVQRLCCTRSLRDAFVVSAIASALFLLFSMLPSWAGINIFGYYASRGCDIYAAGWIKKNEIVLYFVRERLSFPGFQGLFIAALYAGSLSSLSSGLNAASLILWTDTIRPLLAFEVKERRAIVVVKAIVVVFGALALVWGYVLCWFGGLILQVTGSINGAVYGAYFGLFVLTALFLNASYKGALAGLLVAFTLTMWLALGSLMTPNSSITKLPTTTEYCYGNVSVAPSNTTLHPAKPKSGLDAFYSISYVWLTLFCLLVSIGTALLVSGCFRAALVGDANLMLTTLLRRCVRSRRPSDAGDSPEEQELRAKDEEQPAESAVVELELSNLAK